MDPNPHCTNVSSLRNKHTREFTNKSSRYSEFRILNRDTELNTKTCLFTQSSKCPVSLRKQSDLQTVGRVPLAEENPFPKALERGISTPSATDTRYIV